MSVMRKLTIQAHSIRIAPARSRRIVWVLATLQTLMFIGVSILYPPMQNPDEPAHIDMVLAYRHGEWLLDPGGRQFQIGVLKINHDIPNFARLPHLGDQEPLRYSQRLSFDQLGTAPGGLLPNQMVEHPPAYYILAAGFTYLTPWYDSFRFDVQVFILRLLSMLLLLPVPILLFRMGVRLTGSSSIGMVAAIALLFNPTYLRMGASVTNDSLLMLLGTVLFAGLSKVVTGNVSTRTAATIGVAWGLGLLTKGLMLVVPPVILLAYWAGRSSARMAVRSAALSVAVGGLIGGWWWFRNLVAFGSVQPNGFGPAFGPDRLYGRDRPGGTIEKFADTFTQLFLRRSWGTLGLLDGPRLSDWLTIGLAIGSVIVMAGGLAIGFRRTRRRWSSGLALSIAPILVVGLAAYGSYQVYIKKLVFPGVQIRYVLPFAGGLLVAVGVCFAFAHRSRRHWAPLTVFILLIGWSIVWTEHVILQKLSPDVPGLWARFVGGWRYASGWAPWPRPVSALLAAGLVAAAAWVFVELVRWARLERPQSGRRTSVGSAGGRAFGKPGAAVPSVVSDLAASEVVGPDVRLPNGLVAKAGADGGDGDRGTAGRGSSS